MRLCLALLLASLPMLASLPVLAAVPEKGEGDITVLGGLRSIFPANTGYLNEQGASHNPLQWGGLASFGYQYDEELHFKIEIGYMADRYTNPAGNLQVTTIPIIFALDTALMRRPNFTIYGGGGIGYSLNTGARNGTSNEANSTAAYLGFGFRYRLTGGLALVVEDRWTFSNAQVDAGNSTQSFNVGGNFLSVGLQLHFLQPDDHPPPPGQR